MTYSEFKKTYAWMLKKYPGTSYIFRENMSENIGAMEEITCEKRGGTWKIVNRTFSPLTRAIYCNSVDAIPFFRNIGGYERATCGYTRVAYLPVEIANINPDRTKKVIRKFTIQ